MNKEQEKQCSRCKKVKPLREFGKKLNLKSCSECRQKARYCKSKTKRYIDNIINDLNGNDY